MKNADVQKMIVDRMIENIEKTQKLPWQKPWKCDSHRPKNIITKKNYRGINFLLTELQAYESPFWGTFKQIKNLGGNVRKGQKATPILFWKFFDAEKQEIDIQNEKNRPIKQVVCRYYNVFNVCQCENIPERFIPKIEDPLSVEPIEKAETIVRNMPNPPEISHDAKAAFYIPACDKIRMPRIEAFKSMEAYYSTLFHEILHSTGHEKRLNRFSSVVDENIHDRAIEELVAEIGAAFLSAESGIIRETEENSVAYVTSWVEKIKNDPKMIISAASKAEKAFDFIMNRDASASTNEDVDEMAA